MLGNNDWIPLAVPKKKRTLLPLLIVVFLASYGLMTLLIVEQGEAIQQQRNLIQVLQADSRELWATKGRALTAQAEAQSRAAKKPSTEAQAPSVQTPSTQAPMTQAPSSQTPSSQTPSTQAPSTQAPQRHSQSRAGKGAKPQTQVPPMPASDLGDQRRVLVTL